VAHRPPNCSAVFVARSGASLPRGVLISIEWGVHVVPGESTAQCVLRCESPPIPELPPLVVVALGRGSRAPAPSGDGRVAVGARAVRARPVGMYAIPASHCLTVLFMPVGFAPATASAAARGQLVDRLGHVVDSQKISV